MTRVLKTLKEKEIAYMLSNKQKNPLKAHLGRLRDYFQRKPQIITLMQKNLNLPFLLIYIIHSLRTTNTSFLQVRVNKNNSVLPLGVRSIGRVSQFL